MTDVYVCMRASDMPVPYVPCHKGKCRDCKQDVYYSKYVYANDPIIKKIVDVGNLVCVQCATELLQKEPDYTAVVTKAVQKELGSTRVVGQDL